MAGRERVELILVEGELERAVAVEFDPVATIADLGAALDPARGGELIAFRRAHDGRAFPPHLRIGDTGLLRGDRLIVHPAGMGTRLPHREEGRLAIEIVAGPSSGRTFGLTEGEHVIGRAASCDVRLADPLLSREHARMWVTGDLVEIQDAGSTNGTAVEGELLSSRAPLSIGEVAQMGGSVVTLRKVVAESRPHPDRPDGLVAWNPPVPTTSPGTVGSVAVPPPPADPRPARLPMTAALVPLILGLLLFFLAPASDLPSLAIALTPVVAVGSLIDRRSRGLPAYKQEVSRWRREIGSLATTVRGLEAAARTEVLRSCPDVGALRALLTGAEPAIWKREPHDPRHLYLRIGWGERSFAPFLELAPGGSERLRAEALAEMDRSRRSSDGPIGIDLHRLRVLGITGAKGRVMATVRWLSLQAAALHRPSHLGIATFLGPEAFGEDRWLRWLPHTGIARAGDGTGLEPSALLARCFARLDEMQDEAHLLVLVDDEATVDRGELLRLTAGTRSERVSLIWFGSDRSRLPHRCDAFLDLSSSLGARLESDEPEAIAFEPEGVHGSVALDMATRLAPFAEPGQDLDRLAPRPSVRELLEIASPDDVAKRWASTKRGHHLYLGRAAGRVVSLELETRKSLVSIEGPPEATRELLRATMLSIACDAPPDEIFFVLIDGGSSLVGLEGLPHVVASFSGDSSYEIQRIFTSLASELDEKGSSRASDPTVIFIVDDVGALIDRDPDVAAALIEAVRRSRAPGIHLVTGIAAGNEVAERVRGLTDRWIVIDGSGRGLLRSSDEQVAFRAATSMSPAERPRVVVEELDGSASVHPSVGEEDEERLLLRLVADAQFGRPVAAATELWMPPLPDSLPPEDIPAPDPSGDRIPIGLSDDPARRLQNPFALELGTAGNVLVFGGPRTGKTSLLVALATQVARTCSPNDVQFYGLDFGDGGLRTLTDLPHCGSVIGRDDPELVDRLFALVAARMRAPVPSAVSRTIVLLDNFHAFESSLAEIDGGRLAEGLRSMLGGGPHVRVHFVVTATRAGEIPASITAAARTKLVFRMEDGGDYRRLGVPEPDPRAMIPGRFLTGAGLLGQCAMAPEPDVLPTVPPDTWSGGRAPAIVPMPARIGLSEIDDHDGSRTMFLGVGEDLLPAVVDLNRGSMLISGPRRSGRSTALATVATSARRARRGSHLFLVAPRPPQSPDPWDEVAWSSSDRLQLLEALDDDFGAMEPAVLFVDDAEEFQDREAAALERLAKRSRDGGITLVVAADSGSLLRTFGGWLGEIRKEKNGLILVPQVEVDGELFGIRLPRNSVAFPPGRGYLLHHDGLALVQVALPE